MAGVVQLEHMDVHLSCLVVHFWHEGLLPLSEVLGHLTTRYRIILVKSRDLYKINKSEKDKFKIQTKTKQ